MDKEGGSEGKEKEKGINLLKIHKLKIKYIKKKKYSKRNRKKNPMMNQRKT